ncbi:Type I restriction-modification system, specificity subunit S [Methanosarcina siciliae C2J]|uniref:Type I restriction-modification system, specificity subunit S n=1 Tax=Methanosarcina siciliae C2J TaxID=1434118 RepID=A0A0E3PLI3_9EURY|nr:restriction endonuclease subunit S [Methanosarcina siciliae]AKB36164.1 Type I restriction-modification system, specificity subunit S [Methanosarcina siciliae C2J]
MEIDGWHDAHLEDVAELTVGYVGTMANEYVPSGIPFLRSLNIEQFRINTKDMKYISRDFHQKLSKSQLQPGDLVIVRTGKPGACAIIPEWLKESNCSDIVIVRPSSIVDRQFLMYYINSIAIPHVAAHLVGAVQQHFNVGSAKKILVRLPPLTEQREISYILSTLDKKIELNRKMNQTLESIAQAIFKSWFVDFDPVKAKATGESTESICHRLGLTPEYLSLFPDGFEDSELGEIPRGWKVEALSKLVRLNTESVKPYQKPEKIWTHYSIPAYDQGQRAALEIGVNIKSNKYLVEKGSILVSKLNPQFPRTWLPNVTDSSSTVCSTEFMQFVPHESIDRSFVYYLVTSAKFQSELLEKVTGSTGSRQRVTPSEVLKIQFALPKEKVRRHFSELSQSMLAKKLQSIEESYLLANVRDTLLPKLLSGEICVKFSEEA